MIHSQAGHAFPTGDMFRRVRLDVFGEDERGAIVASAERVFGRTWGAVRDGPHVGRRTQTSDTRIQGSWSEDIVLEGDVERVVRTRYELVYERVVAQRGESITLASSDILASGAL